MKVMTTRDVRANFASVLNSVVDDQEELVIPRDGGTAVVIVDLDTWNGMKETLHVLGGRAQTRRLLDSLDAADRGEFVEHKLPELEEGHADGKADAA